MMKLVFFTSAAAVFFFLVPLARSSFAATLQLDPSTASVSVNQTFEVKITVNSGGEEINAVDAFVLYDKNLLEIQSVNDGSFFPTVLNDIRTAGRAYVAGIVDNPGTFKVGSGIVAGLLFKAKAAGTTTLVFDCTQGSTKDSNVVKNDLNASDIIQCAGNGKSVMTVNGGAVAPTTAAASPTFTPIPAAASPTPTPRPTAAVVQPTVSQLPKSGVLDNVVNVAAPGVILVIIGLAARLLF